MEMCHFWAALLLLVGHNLGIDLNNPFFKNVKIDSIDDLHKIYPNNPFFKMPAKIIVQTTTTTTTTISKPSENSLKNSDVCGKAVSANQLIVNGLSTGEGDWPWIVAIFLRRHSNYESDSEFRCGGNLINRRYIVSAGHCFMFEDSQTVNAYYLDAYLGIFDLTRRDDPNIQHKKVEQIIIHADYKYGTYSDADLAVLRMKSLAEYTLHVRPICSWKWTTDLQDIVGKKGTVIGWGRNELKERPTNEPQLVDLPIVSQEECRKSDPRFEYLTSQRTFCAGLRNDSGPCNGDSGSGLILKLKDDNEYRWFLRGVTSISLLDKTHNILCNLKQYVVFTDVAQYRSWLKDFLTEE